ncbi:MAG: DNA-binding protein Alba [Candidatus Bathyarchaeota archaeon]|jgi:DNA-binding protein Alba|nr:DNA-binding protein Alba [Candidatus Bathyarchaeota archaeon]
MSKDPNTVFIGRKPTMNYVLAVITIFGGGETKEVTLKARGMAISTAVDVAEITRRRFMQNLKVERVNLGTEDIPMQEGGTRAVSTIEILLVKSS